MIDQPILNTPRLTLRPFAIDDANTVQRLAGDERIASTTLNVPHPYENGLAEEWIRTHQGLWQAGRNAVFAMVDKSSLELVGSLGLRGNFTTRVAELGYWVGYPYWGKGICSEACHQLLAFGFDTLNLHKIVANHMARNPASGRVMQRIGMQREGLLREHALKNGVFEDLVQYGILAREFGTTEN